MNTVLITPKQNRLLAKLPVAEYQRLEPELEAVLLTPDQLLYKAGDALDFLYFPTAGICSLIYAANDGATLELAVTGNDGVVGTPAILGSGNMTHDVLVRGAGNAYRIRSDVAHWFLGHGGELQRLVILYTQILMTQIGQTAVCNRHHNIEQQLCRRLLLCLDQLPGAQLDATQARIAALLGVRRGVVAEAAGKLQSAGLITYSRGKITILDRAGLLARACGCYAAIKGESDRLLHSTPKVLSPPWVRPQPTSLRARAEKQHNRIQGNHAHSPVNRERLVHELEVHQIELEMQNEALANACAEAEAAHQRAADIYDFAPVAYVTIDALSAILQINLAGAILLGITRSEINTHRFGGFVSPASLPVFKQFLADVLAGQAHRNCELEIHRARQKGDSIVHVEGISDENGQECRMVISDITVQRHAEYALREQEQYQRTLLDNFPFLVWLKDDESRFLAVNRPFAAQFGWPLTESLVGKTDFDITSPDLAEAYRADDRAILDSGRSKVVEEWIEDHGRRRWSETFKSPVILNGRVIGTVGFARDITERKEAEQEMRHLAFYDSLTGLPNRRLLIDRLEQSMMLSARNGSYGATMFLDLDNFKRLNDAHGHSTGDALLVLAADRIKACVREMDTASRLGGDEFVVVISELDTDQEAATSRAMLVAEKIRASLSKTYRLTARHEGKADKVIKYHCAASIGVVLFFKHDTSPHDILKRADQAMYQAKEAGRNQIHFAT